MKYLLFPAFVLAVTLANAQPKPGPAPASNVTAIRETDIWRGLFSRENNRLFRRKTNIIFTAQPTARNA